MTTETEITDKNIGALAKIWPTFQLTLPVVAHLVNTAKESGRQEERERCAVLCEDTAMTTPYVRLKPTHDIYTPEPSHHKEDNSHHVGLGYAALLRSQKP